MGGPQLDLSPPSGDEVKNEWSLAGAVRMSSCAGGDGGQEVGPAVLRV